MARNACRFVFRTPTTVFPSLLLFEGITMLTSPLAFVSQAALTEHFIWFQETPSTVDYEKITFPSIYYCEVFPYYGHCGSMHRRDMWYHEWHHECHHNMSMHAQLLTVLGSINKPKACLLWKGTWHFWKRRGLLPGKPDSDSRDGGSLHPFYISSISVLYQLCQGYFHPFYSSFVNLFPSIQS